MFTWCQLYKLLISFSDKVFSLLNFKLANDNSSSFPFLLVPPHRAVSRGDLLHSILRRPLLTFVVFIGITKDHFMSTRQYQ